MPRQPFLLLAMLLTTLPASAQPPAPAATYVAPAAPGDLIDIGGRRLHIDCKGNASGPTVIFEAGLSQWAAHSTYGKSQDIIAQFARVCTYDRAGLGWSDAVASPRTHLDMVKDLRRLVRAKHLERPLILVGHSMGGLLVRLYAKRYPREIAGVILVDASPESVIFGAGAGDVRKAAIAQIDKGLRNVREGIPVIPFPQGTPSETMMAFTPSILRTVKQEYEAIDLVPASPRGHRHYGVLGRTPLVIIRRGADAASPSEVDTIWRQQQEEMLSLSSRSSMLVADKAGHVIPYDQPAIVAEAVKKVLEMMNSSNH